MDSIDGKLFGPGENKSPNVVPVLLPNGFPSVDGRLESESGKGSCEGLSNGFGAPFVEPMDGRLENESGKGSCEGL